MTPKKAPLPWTVTYDENGSAKFVTEGGDTVPHLSEAAYIAHAANAYPKLVQALRAIEPHLNKVTVAGPVAEALWLVRDALRDVGEAD
jgi:hypothetical protein